MTQNASDYADALAAHVTDAAWAIGLSVLALVVVLAIACLRRPGSRDVARLLLAPIAALPFALFLGATPPPVPTLARGEAVVIHARAHRWRWEFEQSNGMIEGRLLVPVGRTVHLVLTSEGPEPTVHSFHVPALGIGVDVAPGQKRHVSFVAEREGDYLIECGAFCGAGHARMSASLVVVSQAEFDRPYGCTLGLHAPLDVTMAEWGERVFANNGCPACHTVGEARSDLPSTQPSSLPDDEPSRPPLVLVGPGLYDLVMRERTLSDGAVVLADTDYLRRAIVRPQDDVVVGYEGTSMPAFNLSEAQLDALLAYLHALSASPELRERAKDFEPY
ncbi:MAG: hypothetical protein SangKO_032560 [Sandaracinaceae bacterium]